MFLYCLIFILIIILAVNRWKQRRLLKLHEELGNDFVSWPAIGNAMNFVGDNEDKMNTFIQFSQQAYKRKHRTISFWLGHYMFVLIADADQASVVLKNALEKSYIFKFTKSLGGYGSIFAPVKYWQPRRKIMTSILATKHINKFVPVFEGLSKVEADLLESKVGKGNIRCLEYFGPSTLAFVCGTLFGVDIDVQRQTDNLFLNAFMDWLKNTATQIFQPWLHVDAIYKLFPIYEKQERNIKIVNNFIDYLIRQNKESNNGSEGYKISDNAKSVPSCDTLLQLLREYSKEAGKEYTDEELREEAIGIALAATDTSALTASFIIVLLSQHMDVQDKVYEEIQEVLGDPDKPLHADNLLKLKYTIAVIKETLRLYPPISITLRHNTEDIQLPSGLVLPEGCNIIISFYGIQRNPEHWGEDANEFKPERFLNGRTLKQNAFMAFSYGPRNCAGRQYAMLSLITMLVVLLRRFRFTPAENYKYDRNNKIRLAFCFTSKDVDGFLVQVEHRDQNQCKNL